MGSKQIALFGVLILGMSTMFQYALSQVSRKVLVALVISTDSTEVKTGQNVEIKLKITNLSTHDVDCSRAYTNGIDRLSQYEVTRDNGKIVKQREYPHFGHMPTSLRTCTLEPGESTDERGSSLSARYDMTKPGVYKIRAFRQVSADEKEGRAESNIITVTVVP